MTFGSTFGRVFSPTFQPKSQAAAAYELLAQAAIKINSEAIDNFINRIG